MNAKIRNSRRTGAVYIAVLGTSLLVALLGLSALMGQRIQNRMLSSAGDIRQAQLNANSAIELALLTMKNDVNWRSTTINGNWFTNRSTGDGACTVNVTDPVDSNLANSGDDVVRILGIGYRGHAQQRAEVIIEPRRDAISSLRSAIAVGDNIELNSDILRTNGLISAQDTDATSSFVYGTVQAVTVGGSTYSGTTTQITEANRPPMPDWASAFNYYLSNGTEITIGSLPSSTPNLGRNTNINNGTTDWTGSPPWTVVGGAEISQSNSFQRNGTYSLRVANRDFWYSGASQRLDHIVKPGGSYNVEVWVYVNGGLAKNFCLTLVTKGTGSAVQLDAGPVTTALIGVLNIGWTRLSATLTAPSWSGNLEYAFLHVAGGDALNTGTFYVDDLDIRENTSGRFIYRQVISPSINPFGGSTNSQGIYWINCNGQRLVIERSRILGTLLVLNPGANSCVANGPINWSPAVAGYPALLVDADSAANANFMLRATNRRLSEDDDQVNYNPTGAAYDFNSTVSSATDSSSNDVYPSEIRGLVVVRGDLNFQNRTYVRGQVVVGDDIQASSGELEVDYQRDSLLNPPPGFFAPYTYVRRPGSVRKVVLP